MSDSSDGCGCSGCIGTIIALVIISALISALSSVFAFIMEYWYVILIITVSDTINYVLNNMPNYD